MRLAYKYNSVASRGDARQIFEQDPAVLVKGGGLSRLDFVERNGILRSPPSRTSHWTDISVDIGVNFQVEATNTNNSHLLPIANQDLMFPRMPATIEVALFG